MSEEQKDEYKEGHLDKELTLEEILNKVSNEVRRENQSILEKLRPIVAEKSGSLFFLSSFYFKTPKRIREKIEITPHLKFYYKRRLPVIYPSYYFIEVSKEDILNKARELGISDEMIENIFESKDEKSVLIRYLLMSLAGYEKIKQNPKIFEELSSVVADISTISWDTKESLERFLRMRARKRLDEVS